MRYLFGGLLIGLEAVVVWFGSHAHRAGLLWILSLITRGRYPLGRELEDLSGSLTGGDRQRVAALMSRLHGGQTLGEALAATPGLVPPETALLTQVAEEQSASVASVFAHESARLLRIREAAVSATNSPWLPLIYLVVVPILMTTVLTGIMIFIIPKFKKIFNDFGSALPPATEMLVAAADGIAIVWYAVFAMILLGAYVVLFWILRGRLGKTPLGVLKIWPSSRRKRSSLALRAIEIAVREKLPFENALGTLARKHPDEADRRTFQKLCGRIGGGEDVWNALSSSRLISRGDAELLRAAQGAGNLPWALHYIIERDQDRAATRFAAKIEVVQPLLVIAIGAVVTFVCLGLYLPMIQLVLDMTW